MGADLWVKYFALLLIGGTWLLRRHMLSGDNPLRSLREFVKDENGGAGALDFVLTTAFYLPIIMGTIQFILILNAYQFVKYPAFCATRSAIVVLPETYPDAGRNEFSEEKRITIEEST